MVSNKYYYKNAINCLIEIETKDLINFLPQRICPIEVQHNISLLSLAAFEFYDSPVGPYNEFVVSVVVAPRLFDSLEVPKSALYPINILTNTVISKSHAIDIYKLPHYLYNVDINIIRDNRKINVRVTDGDLMLIDIALPSSNSAQCISEYHQLFALENDVQFYTRVEFSGLLAENQEGLGFVRMHNHKLFKGINVENINNVPYLEREGTHGCETIFEAVRLSPPV